MANGDSSSQSLLSSFLSAKDRDFLIRSNGDQVKIGTLTGKPLGLYFSASTCKPSEEFTPLLLQAYEELESDLEVVFVSSDEDDESFDRYFSKMPWLAVPFSDSDTRASLGELFNVEATTPHLVILDAKGKVSCRGGVKIVTKYGARGYPFTEEKLKFLSEEQGNAKKNQTLTSLLVSPTRNYLVSNDGTKIAVSELEGKMVCLYITVHDVPSCAEFTPKLVDFYKKVKEEIGGEEKFEVVLVSFDSTEDKFRTWFETMPWLAVPFQDETCGKLLDYFQVRSAPTVIVIGRDGKTMNPNVAELIEDFGIEAYPFGPEKVAEFAEVKKARNAEESQTLESVLVHGVKDFVIDNSGSKVPVSELVGKNIILYFSAHWCRPCRKFTPKLASAYHEIKAKDNNNFEVVFISGDENESSFDEYFSTMPWLAVPFDTEIKTALHKKFKISGIPAAVAIGPGGRTLSTEVVDALSIHGVDAYPFTEGHLKKLEDGLDEQANRLWPLKVRREELHEHELVRKRVGIYMCGGCDEMGGAWAYSCEPCDFDAHHKCAVVEEGEVGGEDGKREEGKKEGWICEGDVCRKA